MKKMIEWAEVEVSRGRKLMLFSTIFAFILVTVAVLTLEAIGRDMTGFAPYYFSFSSVVAVAIGFYTGTKPKTVIKESEKLDVKIVGDGGGMVKK